MYLRRIRLANWLKSCSSFYRIWFSFVTGVGINFNPLESNLVWSGVHGKSVRFLMCLLLDFVFSIFLFRLLNLLRLLRFWFSSLRFLTNFPPSMSRLDTEKRQGYDSLTLFWTFFISDNSCIITLTLATCFWTLSASLRTSSCTLLLQAVANVSCSAWLRIVCDRSCIWALVFFSLSSFSFHFMRRAWKLVSASRS